MSLPKGIEFAGDPNRGKSGFSGGRITTTFQPPVSLFTGQPFSPLDESLDESIEDYEIPMAGPTCKRRIKLRD